ncbi:hypothetical protein E1301_Tti014572 [Triplophysa tibetana]|uniref:LINE-1 type transposase domain-containing protein 1 n=1 Tax=Triplophysa tibetana TaxID=1572043 RepID=A0A5A9P913_9TELE|nr:hypothetical protein E1301_Tti014572 [Triplophysa tibetana]
MSIVEKEAFIDMIEYAAQASNVPPANATKQTRERIDSVQVDAREDRRTVTNLKQQLQQLADKMTDIEDRSRRNNVRLVGLPEGAEGSDAAGFLRAKLIACIMEEKNRAHRMYDGRKNNPGRPPTLIFRALRWKDRLEILKGARQAYPVKYAHDNVTLLFFPHFSPTTTAKRKSFNPILKKMTAQGLRPFLVYPAALKLQYNGENMMFDLPQKADDFVSSLAQTRKTYAEALQSNGITAATITTFNIRARGNLSCTGEDHDGRNMDI